MRAIDPCRNTVETNFNTSDSRVKVCFISVLVLFCFADRDFTMVPTSDLGCFTVVDFQQISMVGPCSRINEESNRMLNV